MTLVQNASASLNSSISQPVAGFDTTSPLAITPGVTFSGTGSTETLTLLSALVEEIWA